MAASHGFDEAPGRVDRAPGRRKPIASFCQPGEALASEADDARLDARGPTLNGVSHRLEDRRGFREREWACLGWRRGLAGAAPTRRRGCAEGSPFLWRLGVGSSR